MYALVLQIARETIRQIGKIEKNRLFCRTLQELPPPLICREQTVSQFQKPGHAAGRLSPGGTSITISAILPPVKRRSLYCAGRYGMLNPRGQSETQWQQPVQGTPPREVMWAAMKTSVFLRVRQMNHGVLFTSVFSGRTIRFCRTGSHFFRRRRKDPCAMRRERSGVPCYRDSLYRRTYPGRRPR